MSFQEKMMVSIYKDYHPDISLRTIIKMIKKFRKIKDYNV